MTPSSSDLFEENYFPAVPFQGGFGLLNILTAESLTWTHQDGTLRLNLALPAQAVAAITVEWARGEDTRGKHA